MLIWSHTALSVAALVLVSVKAARIGWPRIRRTLALKRPQQAFSSLVLLALGVPLTLTGAVQFGSPDGTGLFDYVHLIASVWWTVLLQWHLWRYLGRAVSLALAGARAPVDSPSP